jgi:hypothetical protein
VQLHLVPRLLNFPNDVTQRLDSNGAGEQAFDSHSAPLRLAIRAFSMGTCLAQ